MEYVLASYFISIYIFLFISFDVGFMIWLVLWIDICIGLALILWSSFDVKVTLLVKWSGSKMMVAVYCLWSEMTCFLNNGFELIMVMAYTIMTVNVSA